MHQPTPRNSVGRTCMVLTVFLCLHVVENRSSGQTTVMEYPITKQETQSDNYFGTHVPDPYRWLEDPDSPETIAWVESQNKVTDAFLNTIETRDQIRERVTELWNYQRFGTPTVEGGRYFFEQNDGLQNQNVLMVGVAVDAAPRVLLDPNEWSNDGTIDMASWVPSRDGKLLAYGVADGGSDWQTWQVLDVDSGTVLDDTIKWVKFSRVSWKDDSSGFFYSRYDEPVEGTEYTSSNYFQKLYYHSLGTSQSDDELVYKRDDEKEWGFDGIVTEDGNYLVIQVWKGTLRKNQVFYIDLLQSAIEVKELLSGFKAEYEFVGNEKTRFWFLTDDGAPMRRLIEIDVEHPEREDWRELVAESRQVIESASVVGEHFVLTFLADAHTRADLYDLAGKREHSIELPGIGTAGGFQGHRDSPETFFSFTSFTEPASIFRYEVDTATRTLFRRPDLKFDPDDFETEQVFYSSADGTKVPMFLCHRKGMVPDGDTPTILYGYGGFNISITPGFSVTALTWVEAGGMYAVANLRGGGEYGRRWHEAGMKHEKQNVFDDFIAAAEWLIDNRYTRPAKLASLGRSNGGLLVGATMIQRPDLFGAAVPGVGVMDMLRFHKFTIGHAWVSEYGSSDDAEEFKTLFKYSPVHALNPGTRYPATLVLTADHDDRVVPAHSHKFAATLQASQATGGPPCLIRIETRGGHGAGKPTTMKIEEAADILAFLDQILKGPFSEGAR